MDPAPGERERRAGKRRGKIDHSIWATLVRGYELRRHFVGSELPELRVEDELGADGKVEYCVVRRGRNGPASRAPTRNNDLLPEILPTEDLVE
jgi:hypothetical protein